MTLTLVGAPAGSIEQHKSGLVVARAEDYVGPARASLTTTVDAASVSGTVVTETQALVVPSTLGGVGTGTSASARWAIASDTLRIPVADLLPFLGSEVNFDAMVSLKVSGDVPSNARYKKTHAFFNQSAGGAPAGLAWGRDTTLLSGVNIQTELYGDQFLVTAPVTIGWAVISGNTDLVIRCWGVTGGTMSFALDLVYLMPVGGTMRLKHLLREYPPFSLASNGVVSTDEDNDAADNVIGQFSVGVVSHTAGSISIGPGAPTDFQEADDEPTVYDISSDDWTGPSPTPEDPRSRMAFLASPQYIPDVQLVNDPFTAIAPTAALLVAGPEGFVLSDTLGGVGGPGHSSGFNGWTGNNVSELLCYLPSSASQPTGSYAGVFPHAQLHLGAADIVAGATTDPRNFTHTLLGLEDHTSETTWSCNTAAGEVSSLIGFQAFSGSGFPAGVLFGMLRDGYGVWLVLTGGVLTASLVVCETSAIASPTPINGTIYEFATPVTLDASYTAGDTYRVKVERRRYRIRAKVWEDGTAEPGAWTFDEYMPFRWTSGTGAADGFIDYPYDTGWAGNVDHDVFTKDIWFNSQQSIPSYMCVPHVTAPEQHVIAEDYQLWIEPAGSSVIDMLVAEENYDGTSHSNDVTIPYTTIPSGRMVEGSLRKRHFGSDTSGFNLWAWKDGAAGPEMQSSALPYAWELAVIRRRPQIYRRLYG
jgi:hypothetical protein